MQGKPAARLRPLLTAVALWSAALLALEYAGLARFLEHRVVRALEFRARDVQGRAPTLDPKVKVFGLDDATAAMLGGPRLSTQDWTTLLQAIATRKPRVVMIDAMFSSSQDIDERDMTHIVDVATLKTEIAVGAMLSPSAIPYRTSIPDHRFASAWANASSDAPLLTMKGAVPYGPTAAWLESFDRIGHIVQEWPARFAPAVRIAPGVVVPHLGLFAAHERSLSAIGPTLDGDPVPLDDDGLAMINFLTPRHVAGQIKSLRSALVRARAGEPLDGIDADDVVVVIAHYTTGNTDILDSPFGPIPGGYIILSVVNSVLRNDWLKRLPGGEAPLVVACAAVGAGLGSVATPIVFFIVLALLALAHLSAALLAFSLASTTVPWLFPLVALTGAGLTTYAVQRYRESLRRIHLEIEIATASTLQRVFFPSPTCDHEKFALASYYHPADAVGGDWYAYYLYRGRWLHLHVGDVTGHGTSAALLASFAKGATDMVYTDHFERGMPNVSLDLIHRNLNEILRREGSDLSYMTLWSMAIDLETGECICLNSAHRAALILAGDAASTIKASRGPSILGHQVLPRTLSPTHLQLFGDETILILTDGLMEVPSSFGIRTQDRHLRKLLASTKGSSPIEARQQIVSKLELERTRGRLYVDDVTFIVLQLKIRGSLRRAS